jgi:hypothetical protein
LHTNDFSDKKSPVHVSFKLLFATELSCPLLHVDLLVELQTRE